jgi:hypothetical protein
MIIQITVIKHKHIAIKIIFYNVVLHFSVQIQNMLNINNCTMKLELDSLQKKTDQLCNMENNLA